MTGPSTPGQDGPSYGPPSLPEGWIAQWDGISRKYYFVQLSTGASQWETPIHPAPTGPTPQATPQEGIEHPYGVPQQQQEQQQRELDVITNQDGSQSIRHPDGRLEPYSGERGIGSFVANQYMHKQNGGHGQNQSGLAGMASQFLGGGKTHQGSAQSSGAGGIVGALAGSLLGGNKQNHQQTNYSGSPNPQQHQSGIMGSLGGMFGGHQGGSQQQGNNYGYSQGGSTPQGGYSGAPPPAAYQPNNAAQNNYSQPSLNQPFSQNSQPQSYSQPYNGQQPSYGAPQQYGTTPQQSAYGGPQAPYGAGSSPQQYGGQGYPLGNGQPGYGGPPPGMENQQFGGPGVHYQGGQPPIPHGSHPNHGHHSHHGSGSGGPPPGYGQQGSIW